MPKGQLDQLKEKILYLVRRFDKLWQQLMGFPALEVGHIKRSAACNAQFPGSNSREMVSSQHMFDNFVLVENRIFGTCGAETQEYVYE